LCGLWALPAAAELPPLDGPPSTQWEVALGFERAGDGMASGLDPDDELLSLGVGLKGDWLGTHLTVSVSPNLLGEFVEVRGMGTLGLRAFTELGGVELSYGVNAQIEARLQDHFWLAYVSPAEVGVTLYEKGTARVRLLGGVRLNLAGELINSYLIDPNGFLSESAARDLETVKSRSAEGQVSLVYVRTL
jgi:hypothetical protein